MLRCAGVEMCRLEVTLSGLRYVFNTAMVYGRTCETVEKGQHLQGCPVEQKWCMRAGYRSKTGKVPAEPRGRAFVCQGSL